MPIQMKKPGDSSFELTIEDRFDPNQDYVVKVVDMDTADYVSKIDGKPYTSLHWQYCIYDADGVAFSDATSGAVWEGREFSSLSLSGKAKGRMWASAFIGHELTDDECDKIAENFDAVIVGKSARVSFKLTEKKGDGGTVLGHNLQWALVRPLLKPVAATRPAARSNGETRQAEVTAPPVQARESAAEKRARLEQELAAMDDGADDDTPF